MGSLDAGVAEIRGQRAPSFPDCAALHPGYEFFVLPGERLLA
jgi:hypothetical protein